MLTVDKLVGQRHAWQKAINCAQIQKAQWVRGPVCMMGGGWSGPASLPSKRRLSLDLLVD